MEEDKFRLFQIKCEAERLSTRIDDTLRRYAFRQYCAANNENFRGYASQHSNAALSPRQSLSRRALTHGTNAFRTSWRIGVNQAKIYGGLFVSDPNKKFGGRAWEVVSRFTWQAPQVIVGSSFATVSNLVGQVNKVDYRYGTTVLSGNFWGQSGAVALGNYIAGECNLKADPNEALFQHEYGHYRQSQRSGPLYIFVVGIPSLYSAAFNPYNHSNTRIEQNANKRGYEYLYRIYGNRLEWRYPNRILDTDWVEMIQNKYRSAP